jgi:hypothetical protein
MDPATISALASGVVAALAPYLAKAGEAFAKGIGETASSKIGVLYQTLKNRFRSHPAAAEALANLEAAPDDEGTQAALRHQLEEKMRADAELADTLRQLLGKIGQDEKAATFLVQVYGGEVGKIINIGQAGEVLIE